MIVNQQGKPYSKRDGDAYVGDFRAKGYTSDALFNYLCLLGWSPGHDKEKMAREEIVSLFTLDRVKNGPAQMDLKKLTHLNWEYVCELTPESFLVLVKEWLKDRAWMNNAPEELLKKACTLMQSRTNTLADTGQWHYFFVESVEYSDNDAVKLLARDGISSILSALAMKLEKSPFTLENIEKAIRETEKEFTMQEGKLNQPARAAITGITRGAGLYETMEIIGREKCLKRLKNAADRFMKK